MYSNSLNVNPSLKKNQRTFTRVVKGSTHSCVITVYLFSELIQLPPRIEGGAPVLEFGHRITAAIPGTNPVVLTAVHGSLKKAMGDAVAISQLFSDRAPNIGDVQSISALDLVREFQFIEVKNVEGIIGAN